MKATNTITYRNATVKKLSAWLSAAIFITAFNPFSTAYASATGISTWGGHDFNTGFTTIKIPAGTLTHTINGAGLTVNSIKGTFVTVTSSVCNWHMKASFKDANSTTYHSITQSNQSSCNATGSWSVNMNNWKAKPGKACLALYTAFTHKLTEQCHNIHS